MRTFALYVSTLSGRPYIHEFYTNRQLSKLSDAVLRLSQGDCLLRVCEIVTGDVLLLFQIKCGQIQYGDGILPYTLRKNLSIVDKHCR